MKIGILTHYQVHNHGAILQMYGLYYTLKSFNHTPYILTYQKNFDFIPKELSTKYNLSFKSIPFYFQYVKKQGIFKTLFNFNKHKILKSFKSNYYDFQSLKESNMDFVVIGSDEVFSLEVGCNKMMYGYGIPCKNIFSYAPAFGQTNIDIIKKTGCFELIQSGLKTFKAISVRDIYASDTVEQLTGIKPTVVCDPVFLYGFEKEMTVTCNKIPKNKYLLIYAYDNNMNDLEEIAIIKKYAKNNNLVIVSGGYYHKWADININVNPIELISLFKNATCIITDTFHGSVLAILTNRPFASFVRQMNINKMTYLLDCFGVLPSKMAKWEELSKILDYQHNWDIVNKCIFEQREIGMNYLKKVLTNE